MMSDDLDAGAPLRRAMAMMEIELVGLPGLRHLHLPAQLPVVITRDNDRLAVRRQILQKLGCLPRCCLVMDQVAKDDEPARPIFIYQLQQPLRDRRHSPHRDEPACRALAELITKMQVGHSEPALGLMEKREPAIEQDFIGDERLIST